MDVFDDLESEVRSYCRSWPAVFDTAAGARLTDVGGAEYLDFFSGAGALNYGHNPPALRASLVEYLERDGITHGLDMHTAAKADFLRTFSQLVLRPRGLDYKVQFPGPTGTNAVEAALKIARKVTGRTPVVSFTNGFHGMTLGALALTGNALKRRGAGVPLVHTSTIPYDGYLDENSDPTAPSDLAGVRLMRRLLDDPGSGFETPAAVVVETVQGEGGLNVARTDWLQALADLCEKHGILLVVDDVQMGVGRTGPFFSFEVAGVQPDIVCLSKSISGYGLPMALVLLRPEYDQWLPGEHNGTFRGNNPAFVTATAALRRWWADGRGGTLENATARKGGRVHEFFERLAIDHRELQLTPRGRGLARGLRCAAPELAGEVCAAAFARGLLVETAGSRDDVVKVMPPLTITDAELDEGLAVVAESLAVASNPRIPVQPVYPRGADEHLDRNQGARLIPART